MWHISSYFATQIEVKMTQFNISRDRGQFEIVDHRSPLRPLAHEMCHWTPSDTINSSETSWMIEVTLTGILELTRMRIANYYTASSLSSTRFRPGRFFLQTALAPSVGLVIWVSDISKIWWQMVFYAPVNGQWFNYQALYFLGLSELTHVCKVPCQHAWLGS